MVAELVFSMQFAYDYSHNLPPPIIYCCQCSHWEIQNKVSYTTCITDRILDDVYVYSHCGNPAVRHLYYFPIAHTSWQRSVSLCVCLCVLVFVSKITLAQLPTASTSDHTITQSAYYMYTHNDTSSNQTHNVVGWKHFTSLTSGIVETTTTLTISSAMRFGSIAIAGWSCRLRLAWLFDVLLIRKVVRTSI